MIIQEIIKKSLQEIRDRGLLFTPDTYHEIFCRYAKQANVVVEDCQKLEKFIKRLSPELQKRVQGRHISTVDQLVQYLASELMRCDPRKSTEVISAYTLLVKQLLQVISILHNQKAHELAEQDKRKLSVYLHKEEIDEIRHHWSQFVESYDDSFLKELKSYCEVRTEDLEFLVHDVVEGFKKKDEERPELTIDAELIYTALMPSMVSELDDELTSFHAEIETDIEALSGTTVTESLQQLTQKRIEFDQKSVHEKLTILTMLIEHIEQMVGSSHEGDQQIDPSKFTIELFDLLAKKLFGIAEALGKEEKPPKEQELSESDEVAELQKKISLLEEALRIERKVASTDTLTKLPNRRGINHLIAKEEIAFKQYGRNFSIILLDIDQFHTINNQYGHDIGDEVLIALAKVLKEHSDGFEVGRWDGDAFMVVLPDQDKQSAYHLAEKLREIVMTRQFIYKGTRVPVTVSGGVGERIGQVTIEAMLQMVQTNLRQAKESGRNSIVS